jgi:membrane-associated protease RseP (regulator of RpoE activity)
VSSREFTPAPYPYFAEGGTNDPRTLPFPRARERYWLHGLLFALTLLTTSIVGAAMQADFARNLPFDLDSSLALWSTVWRHPAVLLQGLPFSLTLLVILLAHEFGHYLAAMFHGVDASLPYFMPSPVLGTFGAFIRVRSPIYSKRVLFDIGIAGPLAGFVFLLPALSIGLAFSKVIPGIAHQGDIHFGVPLLQWLLERAIFPGAGSADIYLHPIARGAWIGMFATALNLLPIGQLDGGHIVYSFFPRQHKTISRVLSVLLILMGIPSVVFHTAWFWQGWLFWGLLLLWLGRRHPAIDDPTRLDPGRVKLGWIALLLFVLCFMLVPVNAGGL